MLKSILYYSVGWKYSIKYITEYDDINYYLYSVTVIAI